MTRLKKFICYILVSCALMSAVSLNCYAAEEQPEVEVMTAEIKAIVTVPYAQTRATVFTDASISATKGDSGEMLISIMTGTSKLASVIGVKDIVVYKKSFLRWTEVATSSGGETYNSYSMACENHFYGAVEGETYKISCTHYANVDGYRELENESGDFKFNF